MKLLGRFFAHEDGQPDQVFRTAWLSLEAQTLQILRELDSSGVSRVVGDVAPEYLADFSYRDAHVFREYEERALSDFKVPEEGWERFWALVDRDKGEWLSQVRELRPYSAYEHLSPRIVEQFEVGPGPYKHLSPFKWWKPVVAVLGNASILADTLGAVPTGGLTVASIVAGSIADVALAFD